MSQTISKVLSPNDAGETGSHQAGILIPLDPKILDFFPKLDATRLNPRVALNFLDSDAVTWEFTLIYYNNRLFQGTRNEYRLTRMTGYIRQARLTSGDEIALSKIDDKYYVCHKRTRALNARKGNLKVGAYWRVIEI